MLKIQCKLKYFNNTIWINNQKFFLIIIFQSSPTHIIKKQKILMISDTPYNESIIEIQKFQLFRLSKEPFTPSITAACNGTFLQKSSNNNHVQLIHFDQKGTVLGQYQAQSQFEIKFVCLGSDRVLFAHGTQEGEMFKKSVFWFIIWDLRTNEYFHTGIKHIKTGHSLELFYFSQSRLICVREFIYQQIIILTYYNQLTFEVQHYCYIQLKKNQFGGKLQGLKLVQIDQFSTFAIFKQKTTKNFAEFKLLSYGANQQQPVVRNCIFSIGSQITNNCQIKILQIHQIQKNELFIDLMTKEINYKQKSYIIKLLEKGFQIKNFPIHIPQKFYNIQFINKPFGKLENEYDKSFCDYFSIYKTTFPTYFIDLNKKTLEYQIVKKKILSNSFQTSPQTGEYISANWRKTNSKQNQTYLELTRITLRIMFRPDFLYAAFFIEEIFGKECDCDLIDQVTQMLGISI